MSVELEISEALGEESADAGSMSADLLVDLAIFSGAAVTSAIGITCTVCHLEDSVRQVIAWANGTCTVWREAAVPSVADHGRPRAPLLVARNLGTLPVGAPALSHPMPFLGLPRCRRSERHGWLEAHGPR
jgi:hypothetical protein